MTRDRFQSTISADVGRGRAVCILRECDSYAELGSKVHQELAQKTRAVLIELPEVTKDSWRGATTELLSLLSSHGLRQASFVALGPASSVLLNLYLQEPKLVRTVVFLDATSRPHPTRRSRLIDFLEERLPLGLPLRLRSDDFDAKPFLHRIRCPVMLATSIHASAYVRAQSKEMSARLPTAWHCALNQGEASTLPKLVLDFIEVPARCPQKNIAGARVEVQAASSS